ncbi:MAG: glycosyltransferase [Sulfuriferula sp.]
MDEAMALWKRGEYPGHHLWGATHFEENGIEFDIAPLCSRSHLQKFGLASKRPMLEALERQLRILVSSRKYDVIYSASQNSTWLLSWLRSRGLFSTPIVAVVHHPLRGRLTGGAFIKGHDRLLFLSEVVQQYAERRYGKNLRKFDVLPWGVDLDFYPSVADKHIPGQFFISAGKVNRDNDTLAAAFSTIEFPLEIYCSEETRPRVKSSANVSVHSHPTGHGITYKELLREYGKAYAIAICLKDTEALAGLTSLYDAMAMGKAVVMTRNKNIDIDIEKEGIGIWIEVDDIEAWRRAINLLVKQPGLTMSMGEKARQLCKKKFSLEIFSSQLVKVLKSVQA